MIHMNYLLQKGPLSTIHSFTGEINKMIHDRADENISKNNNQVTITVTYYITILILKELHFSGRGSHFLTLDNKPFGTK